MVDLQQDHHDDDLHQIIVLLPFLIVMTGNSPFGEISIRS